ncbi:spore coat protein [Bacillus gobiensis]|uniref:spore coat protein n=1 Tax=Bacillus gobiensis TaxID=1441095 RepID=UPI003D204B05
MQQQNQQMNMNQQNMPMNHGGHEVFDLQEVLSGMISVLDQYIMFRQYVKDPELLDMLDRQYQFISNHYNITVECFKTGRKPAQETSTYMMKQDRQVTYGIKAAQPKKPCQSLSEVKDAGLSGHMLGLIKSQTTMLTMAALESTNPVVRRVVADQIPNYIEMAYEIFLYQNKHEYYQVPQLSPEDMQKATASFAPANGNPQMPNAGSNQGTLH